jgi:hypothetical protein
MTKRGYCGIEVKNVPALAVGVDGLYGRMSQTLFDPCDVIQEPGSDSLSSL